MTSAAELLTDREIKGGWIVTKKITQNSQFTGGNFSIGYEVEKDGQVAFLKALDFSGMFKSNREYPATIMQIVTETFNFEKTILEMCRDTKIKNVVKLLDDGTEEVEGSDPPCQTQYLIFEWAESDVRKKSTNSKNFNPVWALKCMHEITSGLYHLHQKKIIHQDVKPSNMLIFEKNANTNSVKIGDFGRAYSANHEVEYNKQNLHPGDSTYAPPEIVYGYQSGPSETIRQGVDVYMLGSMLYFFFTQCPLTPKIIQKIPPKLHPTQYSGTKENILPYLQKYYDEAVEEFAQNVHINLREEITRILKELTNLMPEKRGHPTTHRSAENNLSLGRYVSIFDRLSKKYQFQEKHNFRIS